MSSLESSPPYDRIVATGRTSSEGFRKDLRSFFCKSLRSETWHRWLYLHDLDKSFLLCVIHEYQALELLKAGVPFIMGYSLSLKVSTPSLYAMGWIEQLMCMEFETRVDVELPSLELWRADIDGRGIPDM